MSNLFAATPVSDALLLGFGFVNGAMLFWLVAAGLPLLIHLWNRRQYREVRWAAITFLLAAMQKNSRRLRMENWLLLLIRTMLVAVVVLAVAGPYLEGFIEPFDASERTHHVLVIDASYSMAYRPTDRSRFDRAMDLASQLVQQSRQGDGFTLLLMAAPPRTLIASPAYDRDEVVRELSALRTFDGGADLPATLAQAEKVLQTARRDHARLTQEEIVFFTDLGRTTWAAGDAKADRGWQEFSSRTSRLAESARLRVIDLGQSDAENVAITSLRAAEPIVTLASAATWQATVRNFGLQSRPVRVHLHVDGQAISQRTLELPAGREQAVAFSYRFETAGNHTVEVRLSADGLEVDNRRFAAVEVKEFVSVLCIDGKPATPGQPGAAHYLELALNPDSRRGAASAADEPSPIQVQVISESALADFDITPFDCVFLPNVGQFTALEARQLRAYLERGGGLVFFLGDRVSVDRYNQTLAGDDRSSGRVLPASLLAVAPVGKYTFDPLGYQHPLLDAFRGFEASGLTSVPTQTYIKLAVPKNSKAREALRFRETGDPAIVEETIGRGRSIVVATAATVERGDNWTALPLWENWPPLVLSLLQTAIGRQSDRQNAQVGAVVELPLAAAGVYTLRTPDGRTEMLRSTGTTDAAVLAVADTMRAGIYAATAPGGSATSATYQFAVNLDTRESDLTKIDPVELPAGFSSTAELQNSDRPTAETALPRGGLHRWMLSVAVWLLAADTLLAWYFGRGQR